MEENTFEFCNLPNELQLKIYSYLRPFDLRQCRLVSKTWNSFLTSTKKVQERLTFLVSREDESWSVFNKSKVPWANLRLTVSHTDTGYNFSSIPIQSLTSLSLELRTRAVWEFLVLILEQFMGVKELSIKELEFPYDEELELGLDYGLSAFQNIVKNLEGLSLEVHSLDRIRDYLINFKGATGLTSLQVHSRLDVFDEVPPIKPLPGLINLIMGSVDSLKVLNLEFSPDAGPETWDPVVRYLIPNAYGRKALDLTTLHTADHPLMSRDEREDLEPYMESHIAFFKSQPGLKDVGLNWLLYGTPTEVTALLASIPTGIERLEIWGRQAVPELLNRFPDLINLSVWMDMDATKERCIDGPPLLEALENCEEYLGLGSLSLHYPNEAVLLESLRVFPRLTALHVKTETKDLDLDSESLFTDAVLQEVIRVLTDLRSLKLEASLDVTDFGVSGVPLVEMTRLRRQKVPWEGLDSEGITRTGLPIHSLTRLEELVLSNGASITDAGIEFGFQFKGLRKLKLKLGLPNVTNSGLKRLGELNPTLIEILIGRSATTAKGRTAFRQAFKHVPRRCLRLC